MLTSLNRGPLKLIYTQTKLHIKWVYAIWDLHKKKNAHGFHWQEKSNNNKKKGELVGVALLYTRLQVGHCNGWVWAETAYDIYQKYSMILLWVK